MAPNPDTRVRSSDDDWFTVLELTPSLFVFREARHFEDTLVHLVIGHDRAALIDTGCGIGDMRQAVRAITDKPVVVINTHSHPDHVGSNRQFEDIALFDHPAARAVAEQGVADQIVRDEILAAHLVTGPWPEGFDPGTVSMPPFQVRRWLRDGDRIDLGGRDLLVIHTPGEAPDHICLLDRTARLLFCGDILLQGPVWTHLEGGNLNDLVKSYQRLLEYVDQFDRLMPGHNEPWLGKELLPAALTAARQVAAGLADFRHISDPWGRRLREYSFGAFSILTSSSGAPGS